jgi:hypothetical protein
MAPFLIAHPLVRPTLELVRHAFGLEVHHEEGLAADDLRRLSAFRLHARQDRARVVAEVHCQLEKLAGVGDIVHRQNGSDSDVELLDVSYRDGRLDRGWRELAHLVPPATSAADIGTSHSRHVLRTLPNTCEAVPPPVGPDSAAPQLAVRVPP